MQINSLTDFFIHSLSDIYNAEKQLTRALSKLARESSNPELTDAFKKHYEETQGQIERLDQLVEAEPNIKLKRMKCHAMEGLIDEANEVIEATEKGSVRDAGLIAAAQKVEHYEIASYGTLCTLASQLGLKKAHDLLSATLEEEKTTDNLLTKIATSSINKKAEGE
ncbi:Ferritin-like metal-binding protein YciE [Phytobacter palmae]|uniref:Ferritin-like domain-containing protein n=1 Tax=Phytobacter palmae TaxID=1855371 RepID=A0ABU9V634_9ENTR|nr:ferritin-like domain-containing protein [Escherichia coli]SFE57904.1 Ferritin-like metal-binding protein YciE [Phytobacter palmae]